MRVSGSSFTSSSSTVCTPSPPHAIRSPPPASDLQERPSSSSSWTGQSRSQARGRLILGASLSTSFIGPARQPSWRAVNRSTLPPPLPTRTRTRTQHAAPLPRGMFQASCLCLTVSLTHLLSPCPHPPLVLYCVGTCHLPLQLHGPPSLSPAVSETTSPPSTPCLPNKLFRQSTSSILQALIPVAPGTSGPSQLGCGCHHPVNHHPLATRHPKPALSQSNLSTSRLFCTSSASTTKTDARRLILLAHAPSASSYLMISRARLHSQLCG